jgi:hypothetical protein
LILAVSYFELEDDSILGCSAVFSRGSMPTVHETTRRYISGSCHLHNRRENLNLTCCELCSYTVVLGRYTAGVLSSPPELLLENTLQVTSSQIICICSRFVYLLSSLRDQVTNLFNDAFQLLKLYINCQVQCTQSSLYEDLHYEISLIRTLIMN